MGIARDLARDRPQPKPFGGVKAGAAQAAVVEHKRFRLAAFGEDLAILGAGRRSTQFAKRRIEGQGIVEGTEGGVCHVG
jgi:hypothetical protein